MKVTGDDVAGWGVLVMWFVVYPVCGAIGEIRSERASRKAQAMLLIDGLGNTLSKDDLVVYTDDIGRAQLCFVAMVMEQGLIQLQPLMIPVQFDLRNPQVGRVIKVQKPPQFREKKVSS